MRLNQKVALITGASGGFGRAIALRFAQEGALLALNYFKTEISEYSLELEKYNSKVFTFQADVSVPEEVDKMMRSVIHEFGRIDILINNAGVFDVTPIRSMQTLYWEKIIDINLKSCFLCSRSVLETMINNEYGKIVNISSLTGQTGRPVGVNYAAAKAGILGFTRALAFEVAGFGINVNVVCPGLIMTNMTKGLDSSFIERAKSSTILSRQGAPEDIANAVLFLSSDESGWITGETISVNGGAFMS